MTAGRQFLTQPSRLLPEDAKTGSFIRPVAVRSGNIGGSARVSVHAACQTIGNRTRNLQEFVTMPGRRGITCITHGACNNLRRFARKSADRNPRAWSLSGAAPRCNWKQM